MQNKFTFDVTQFSLKYFSALGPETNSPRAGAGAGAGDLYSRAERSHTPTNSPTFPTTQKEITTQQSERRQQWRPQLFVVTKS